ncbi:MAG: hypothetical protein EB141_06405, partial [Verrucomicrobia bacterium]|nr:hypothetical protein [Verrucomicrobiota bacterium]
MPAVIYGEGKRQKAKGKSACSVSVVDSSQFASALLLSGGVGGWQVEITGANEDEMPYVTMTRELVKVFPAKGGEFQVEPDASSGSYFWASGCYYLPTKEIIGIELNPDHEALTFTEEWDSSVRVAGWPTSGWQIDEKFVDALFVIGSSAVGFGFETELSMMLNYGVGWRENPHLADDFGAEPINFSRRLDLGDGVYRLSGVPRMHERPQAALFAALRELGYR